MGEEIKEKLREAVKQVAELREKMNLLAVKFTERKEYFKTWDRISYFGVTKELFKIFESDSDYDFLFYPLVCLAAGTAGFGLVAETLVAASVDLVKAPVAAILNFKRKALLRKLKRDIRSTGKQLAAAEEKAKGLVIDDMIEQEIQK